MKTLRSKLIRLAHAKPELRDHLLPLLGRSLKTARLDRRVIDKVLGQADSKRKGAAKLVTFTKVRDKKTRRDGETAPKTKLRKPSRQDMAIAYEEWKGVWGHLPEEMRMEPNPPTEADLTREVPASPAYLPSILSEEIESMNPSGEREVFHRVSFKCTCRDFRGRGPKRFRVNGVCKHIIALAIA